MEENTWISPNNFTVVFRCTNRKYAKTFLELGEIKFNTPKSWVDYANSNTEGRGDKLEGTMAISNSLDFKNIVCLNKKYMKYSDIIREKYGLYTYLKRDRDMKLPCFCFYILKNSMFECPNSEGFHKLDTIIPASYFRDFSDNMTKEEVDNLPDEEKPAIIAIKDYEVFQVKIIDKLLSLGLSRDEIIIAAVDYVDFYKYGEYTWIDLNKESPYQLTIKHNRFADQSEARIIINTDKQDIIDRLDYPIQIGSLENIAQVSNVYLHKGMRIEMDVLIKQHE
jgi:hypothetical protein